MKRVAKQEAQRKMEEEKHKADEEAKQKAEEEKQKTKEEEKQKAEENKCRAEEEYRAQAEVKRKQKADAQEATEAFRAKIGAQGAKPKVHNLSLSYIFFFANFPFCFYSLVGQ